VSEPLHKGWKRWLMFRRSISDPSELTAYIACAPAYTTLAEQVRVAGRRWTVEESIECAKGEVGLDHYEVRSFSSWYRHITLAIWAQAFLSVIRKEAGAEGRPKKGLHKRVGASSLATLKAHRGLRSG
jgi:SRSO17 transposase